MTLLAGWAAAQWPFLIYPDLTVLGALFPALWFLFRVFKSRASW